VALLVTQFRQLFLPWTMDFARMDGIRGRLGVDEALDLKKYHEEGVENQCCAMV
jgi:hypothetical protein